MIGVALVAATVGIQLAEGALGLTAGLTVLILAPELYMPLRRLGAQFHASADGMASAERIFEVLDQPAAVARAGGAGAGAGPAALGAGRVAGVRFSHPGRERGPARRRPAHSSRARRSPWSDRAAAASRRCSRCCCASPTPSGGTISCGGVDLRDVDPAAWRRRDRLGAAAADDLRRHDRRQRAARRARGASAGACSPPPREAGLLEVVERRCRRGWRRASARAAAGSPPARRSASALARAFLRDAPLLLLDEPTAHLDEETELGVAAAIERLAAGRTALLVAHRPELARRADRVLELRDGPCRAAAPGRRHLSGAGMSRRFVLRQRSKEPRGRGGRRCGGRSRRPARGGGCWRSRSRSGPARCSPRSGC